MSFNFLSGLEILILKSITIYFWRFIIWMLLLVIGSSTSNTYFFFFWFDSLKMVFPFFSPAGLSGWFNPFGAEWTCYLNNQLTDIDLLRTNISSGDDNNNHHQRKRDNKTFSIFRRKYFGSNKIYGKNATTTLCKSTSMEL